MLLTEQCFPHPRLTKHKRPCRMVRLANYFLVSLCYLQLFLVNKLLHDSNKGLQRAQFCTAVARSEWSASGHTSPSLADEMLWCLPQGLRSIPAICAGAGAGSAAAQASSAAASTKHSRWGSIALRRGAVPVHCSSCSALRHAPLPAGLSLSEGDAGLDPAGKCTDLEHRIYPIVLCVDLISALQRVCSGFAFAGSPKNS